MTHLHRIPSFARGPLLGCALLTLSACAGQGAKAPRDARLTVERLYPLRAGSVWTYDVDTGEGLPTLAITRVVSRVGGRVEVSSGSSPVSYEVRADGLYRSDLDTYVLREPLRQGESWSTRDGATARIVDVKKQVKVPAGDFLSCVEVLEEGGGAQKRVRTVFCPDVGPVQIESSMQMSVSGQAARVVAELRGYDFSSAVSGAALQSP